MYSALRSALPGTISVLTLGGILACGPAKAAVSEPVRDIPLAMSATQDTAYFASGCFWGVQAVFQHVTGVISATSGYSGGSMKDPSYDDVSSGSTGHAESVRVIYDPSKVTYGVLLKVLFTVAGDPTELDYQGPDHGTQYRSAIFYNSVEQKDVATAYIAQLTKEKAFPAPIVTEVTAFKAFYRAEDYHQDYATIHPDAMYIVINDAPKVAQLKVQFPALWTEKKASS